MGSKSIFGSTAGATAGGSSNSGSTARPGANNAKSGGYFGSTEKSQSAQPTSNVSVQPSRPARSDLNLKQMGNPEDIKNLLMQLGSLQPLPSPGGSLSKPRIIVNDEVPDNAFDQLHKSTAKLAAAAPPPRIASFEYSNNSIVQDNGSFDTHEETVKMRMKEIASANAK